MLPREVEDLGAFRLQGGQPQRAFGLIGLAQLCGIAFGTIAIQPALIERQCGLPARSLWWRARNRVNRIDTHTQTKRSSPRPAVITSA